MTPSQYPSRKGTVFGVLLALPFLWGGIHDLADTMALRRSNEVVDARVTDHRVMSTTHGLSHEVKYVFAVSLDLPKMRRRGVLSNDLWSSLPKTEWAEAVDRGHLPVKYDPSKPGNNAPAVALPKISDSMVPVIIGAFLLACVVVGQIKRARQP